MKSLDQYRALVLFSGGQDSSIALGWALSTFEKVATVGFDYGQRHAVELGARSAVRREIIRKFPLWADKLGEDALIDLSGLGRISDTALTRDAAIVDSDSGLPNTFVPGRNLAFLVVAGALAYRKNIGVLVGGMCEVDYSGYPDCRENALAAQVEALRLGMEADIRLETPLLAETKGASWRLAECVGGEEFVEIVRVHSHTCYEGVRSALREWGYGCGVCPACALRIKGWSDYVESRDAS